MALVILQQEGLALAARGPLLRVEEVEAVDLAAGAAEALRSWRQQEEERSQRAARAAYEDALARGREEGLRQAAQALVRDTVTEQASARALEQYVLRAVSTAVAAVLDALPPHDVMAGLVQQALLRVDLPGVLVLRIASCDADAASAAVQAARAAGFDRAVRIVVDGQLPPRSCRLESEFGSVQADLPIQLAAIEAALRELAQARGVGRSGPVTTERS